MMSLDGTACSDACWADTAATWIIQAYNADSVLLRPVSTTALCALRMIVSDSQQP